MSGPRVTLYGRPGCHLCEEALARLLALRREGLGFELEQIDIESDERLMHRLLERIPVVEVEGERVSELLFDAEGVAALRSSLATFLA